MNCYDGNIAILEKAYDLASTCNFLLTVSQMTPSSRRKPKLFLTTVLNAGAPSLPQVNAGEWYSKLPPRWFDFWEILVTIGLFTSKDNSLDFKWFGYSYSKLYFSVHSLKVTSPSSLALRKIESQRAYWLNAATPKNSDCLWMLEAFLLLGNFIRAWWQGLNERDCSASNNSDTKNELS